MIVVVGDVLLDRDLVGSVNRLSPDAPVPVVDEPVQHSRPGGAGLAAVLAAADDRPVTLITALAADAGGDELRDLLGLAGVDVIDLGLSGATPEKIRVRVGGRTLIRLDRGGAPGLPGPLVEQASDALSSADAVLVADYGRGVASNAGLRAALSALPRRTQVVWDPHPRGPQPVGGATLVTPNAAEAQHFTAGPPGDSWAAVTGRAQELARRWSATAVCITLGGGGALVAEGDAPPLVVPATPVACFDSCGAGDRFASTAAGLLGDGALPTEAVIGAVRAATAFVAAGGAAAVRIGPPGRPQPHQSADRATQRPPQAATVVQRVRATGGTVVATGGVFDLLHAGHVAVLQQARALGDCLVVCLNSDASVRRLKGPQRPLQDQDDRAAVLLALQCVDAVAIFDHDTPSALLEQLRPDVFAKGGDYALTDIPEARVLAGWGGQAVVLPYLDGRSTTALIREARTRVQL